MIFFQLILIGTILFTLFLICQISNVVFVQKFTTSAGTVLRLNNTLLLSTAICRGLSHNQLLKLCWLFFGKVSLSKEKHRIPLNKQIDNINPMTWPFFRKLSMCSEILKYCNLHCSYMAFNLFLSRRLPWKSRRRRNLQAVDKIVADQKGARGP
jgi:uncharacterized membrane protein